MEIENYEWARERSLAQLYIHGDADAAKRFEHRDWNEAAWEKRALWIDAHRSGGPAAGRNDTADALGTYNRRVGASELALSAIEKLRDERSLVVTGGQQAGLFTGPLLVIHKAVTILQTAREAEKRLNRPIVPLFWIAGEDHDFDEVNHTYVMNTHQQVQRIKLEERPEIRTSISRLPISEAAWSEALRELEEALPNTEFKPGLIERLRAASTETLSIGFAKTMAWLFGPYGLVLADADDPAIRRLEGPMFRLLLDNRRAINSAIAAGMSEVKALGLTPQADVQPQSVNLFFYDDGERKLLLEDASGEGFTDKRNALKLTVDEANRLAEQTHDRFSNNVFTRPLMQDYLFPVLAVVLGPGEMNYWGLLRESFHTVGLAMPVLVPRLEFTYVEGTLRKHMDKFGLSFTDAVERLSLRRDEWLAEQDKLHLEQRFAEMKSEIRRLYEPLLETIAGLNPGLAKLGDTNRQKVVEQIDFLEHRTMDALRTQHDAALRQWERIGASLLPLGKPQERIYNPAHFLVKYGEEWLVRLLEERTPLDGGHRVIFI